MRNAQGSEIQFLYLKKIPKRANLLSKFSDSDSSRVQNASSPSPSPSGLASPSPSPGTRTSLNDISLLLLFALHFSMKHGLKTSECLDFVINFQKRNHFYSSIPHKQVARKKTATCDSSKNV